MGGVLDPIDRRGDHIGTTHTHAYAAHTSYTCVIPITRFAPTYTYTHTHILAPIIFRWWATASQHHGRRVVTTNHTDDRASGARRENKT